MHTDLARPTTQRAPRRHCRGGTGLLVVGAVAGAALIAFLAIDLDALERDAALADLSERFDAFAEARRAEDAAALDALLVPKWRADFDADHMRLRWSFDETDVVSVGEPTFDVRWDTGRARVFVDVEVATNEPVVADDESTGGENADGADSGTTDANDALQQNWALEQKWALLDGAWYLVPDDEPWGLERLGVLRALRRELLEERFADFAAVRTKDDQQALYSMYTAADREEVSLANYLAIYGHGVLEVHGCELQTLEVGERGETAHVTYVLDASPVVRNLPPEMQRAMAGQKPEELRGQSVIEQDWRFEDGQWRLLMEEDPTKNRQAPPTPPMMEGPAGPPAGSTPSGGGR